MDYQVRVTVAENGERIPLVVNRATGIPAFSPVVWLIRERRVNGYAVGTLGAFWTFQRTALLIGALR